MLTRRGFYKKLYLYLRDVNNCKRSEAMGFSEKSKYPALPPLFSAVAALCLLLVAACHSPGVPQSGLSTGKDSIEAVLAREEMKNIDSVERLLRQTPAGAKAVRVVLHNELGALYRKKSDFVAAVEQHRAALELAIEERDTVEIIQTYNQLGTDFRRIGSLSDAAEVHYRALNSAELFSGKNSEEGKRLLSYSLNGIGNVYKSLDIRNEAFEYFRRAAELDRELGNHLGLAMNYVTMGSVLEHRNKPDSAMLFFRRALHHDSLANSPTGIAICHNRIGQLLQKQKRWDEALSYYSVAREILSDRGDVWNLLKTESDMAWVFIQQKKYVEAKRRLLSIRQAAAQSKMYGYLEIIHYCLATLHTELGEYRAANKDWKLCLDYRDSIQAIRNEQNVLETRVKFEREMGERRIQNLNRINEQQKKQKELIIVTTLIISILLLGLLVISYYFIRLQQKRNEELKESNATKDKLLSIISHDLKNPVIAQRNSLQSMADLLRVSGCADKTWLEKETGALRKSSESLLELIDNMLDWTRIQRGRMSFRPSVFDLRSALLSTSNLLAPLLQGKEIAFCSGIPEATIVKADKNMTEIVLRNLITNAIKFSKPGGRVAVEIQPQGQSEYKISVIDNGVGLTPEQIKNLFRLDRQQTTPGTSGEKGSGLGLLVCKELVERNGGVLSVTSTPGVKTTFSFTIGKRG